MSVKCDILCFLRDGDGCVKNGEGCLHPAHKPEPASHAERSDDGVDAMVSVREG